MREIISAIPDNFSMSAKALGLVEKGSSQLQEYS